MKQFSQSSFFCMAESSPTEPHEAADPAEAVGGALLTAYRAPRK